MLTDAEIAALTPAERQRLIKRLARPLGEVAGRPSRLRRLRRGRLTVLLAAVVALIPWIVYLGMTLPDRYVVRNWTLTWVGFDLLLLAMFAATAVLALLRRQLVVLSGFATGVLLVCDAWFDVTTAGPDERAFSIILALAVELPVAALLIRSTLRLIEVQVKRMWLVPPGGRLWQAPLLIDESRADGAPVAGAARSPAVPRRTGAAWCEAGCAARRAARPGVARPGGWEG